MYQQVRCDAHGGSVPRGSGVTAEERKNKADSLRSEFHTRAGSHGRSLGEGGGEEIWLTNKTLFFIQAK